MSLTESLSDPSPALHRNVYRALWAVAFVGYFGFIVGGYPLVGVAAFVVGGAAAVAVRGTAESVLFDERDAAIHRQAAGRTLMLFGWVAAVVFPTLVVLDALGRYEWSPFVAGVSTTVIAIYGVYALLLVTARYRR